MASATVVCFLEDLMQEGFVTALVKRAAISVGHHERSISVESRNARGGVPAALAGLARYVEDVLEGREPTASIVVVAIDSDCDVDQRRSQIEEIVAPIRGLTCVAIAVPDPYIERWYLLDLSALKKALGQGPQGAPEVTCEKDYYKQALAAAVEAAGLTPRLGGYEYADLIVAEMNLYRCGKREAQFGRFIDELRRCLEGLLVPGAM